MDSLLQELAQQRQVMHQLDSSAHCCTAGVFASLSNSNAECLVHMYVAVQVTRVDAYNLTTSLPLRLRKVWRDMHADSAWTQCCLAYHTDT